jgi:hypothetical protein
MGQESKRDRVRRAKQVQPKKLKYEEIPGFQLWNLRQRALLHNIPVYLDRDDRPNADLGEPRREGRDTIAVHIEVGGEFELTRSEGIERNRADRLAIDKHPGHTVRRQVLDLYLKLTLNAAVVGPELEIRAPTSREYRVEFRVEVHGVAEIVGLVREDPRIAVREDPRSRRVNDHPPARRP